MTRQLSFTTRELPTEFESAWTALEHQHGVRLVVDVDAVIHERGRTTIVIRIGGRKYAVIGRADLEVAARDLFTQVYGPIAQDNA